MRLVIGMLVTTLTLAAVIAGVLIQLLPLVLLVALALRAIRGPRHQQRCSVPGPAAAVGAPYAPMPPLRYRAVRSATFSGPAWLLVPVWFGPSDPRPNRPVMDAEVIDAMDGWR